MRVIFAGTPEFARAALERLHAAGFAIALVLTQPDRPAGRGMKLHASPVKQFALEQGIAVAQPRSLRLDGKYPEDAAAAQAAIEAARADVMVVAAYGLILPQWVLDAPRLGCLNIHASLLPRWRGAAPIHRAIEAGDAQTGVTIMQMDAGLDTGAMLLGEARAHRRRRHHGVAARQARGAGRAADRRGAGAGRLRRPEARGAARRRRHLRAQDRQGRGRDRLVAAGRGDRAANPRLRSVPRRDRHRRGRSGQAVGGRAVRGARRGGGAPGLIEAAAPDGLQVRCGDGTLRVTQLQRAGGKRLPVADFLRGFELKPGMVFESRPS